MTSDVQSKLQRKMTDATQLQTDEPKLADLSWAKLTWEGNALRDHDWTFELISGAVSDATPSFPDITLKAPCPVLMIAPSTAPHAEVHYRALEERLKHAWRFYHEKPQIGRAHV